MSARTVSITSEQAALVAELTAQVAHAQASLDLAVNAMLRGHGITAGVATAFDMTTPSLTVSLPDAPVPALSPVPSPES